jgi:hypothetical protein
MQPFEHWGELQPQISEPNGMNGHYTLNLQFHLSWFAKHLVGLLNTRVEARSSALLSKQTALSVGVPNDIQLRAEGPTKIHSR